MKLRSAKRRKVSFSDYEKFIVKTHYSTVNTIGMLELLPGKTAVQISQWAAKLGVKKINKMSYGSLTKRNDL